MSTWWITSYILEAGGEKLIGPFPDQEIAIRVRRWMIDNGGDIRRLFVDETDEEFYFYKDGRAIPVASRPERRPASKQAVATSG